MKMIPKKKRTSENKKPFRKDLLVGASEYMEGIRAQVKKVATTDIPVLILGETGTGKELIARSIHQQSTRRTKPFVPVNCAAIPETLSESELFGHVKGAFSGAIQNKEGKVSAADEGTLFLDEIGDLGIENQAKLLRFLESGEYTRLGANKIEYSGARIVAATNKDLRSEIEKGKFRGDLYQRITGHVIKTKPLSSSREDVVSLTNHFLGRGKNTLEKARIKSLIYSTYFPGNARQLGKTVEAANALGYEDLRLTLLDFHFERMKEAAKKFRPSAADTDQREKKEEAQRFEKEQRSINRFIDTLQWTDQSDPKEIKDAVLAYEIITLWQETELSQTRIANALGIRKELLSSPKFRSKFGFDLPDRGKRKYPLTHPMDANPQCCRGRAIRNPLLK